MEANARTHDRAQGGTTVLQDPKGSTVISTAVPLCTVDRACQHGQRGRAPGRIAHLSRFLTIFF